MTRILVVVAALCVFAACSSGDEEPATQSQAKNIVDRATAVAERPVGKQEMLGLLTSAGLDPTEKPALRVSNKMEQALPEQPRDHFMLGIDGEALIAFEFSSVDAAKQMDEAHDQGFRYRNWYFGGIVSTAVTDGMKSAFE